MFAVAEYYSVVGCSYSNRTGIIVGKCFLTNQVGMGSRSQDFGGYFIMRLDNSSAVTRSKFDRVLSNKQFTKLLPVDVHVPPLKRIPSTLDRILLTLLALCLISLRALK